MRDPDVADAPARVPPASPTVGALLSVRSTRAEDIDAFALKMPSEKQLADSEHSTPSWRLLALIPEACASEDEMLQPELTWLHSPE